MKAVITVTGRDTSGIIAKVSAKCAQYNANISDISQSVLQDYFAMIMIVQIDALTVPFPVFVEQMNRLGEENGFIIHTMHEDIFDSMHRI